MLVESLSVIIPVYNSGQNLEPLLERLAAQLPKLATEYEVILINDGSQDNSWEVICQLVKSYPWARGVNLMRNYGQHNALLCGIRIARYEVSTTMDDDQQHPPEELEKLLGELAKGYDVVYGIPEQEQHGLWRDLASQVTKMALRSAAGAQTARNVSAFRAFRTQLRQAFQSYNNSYVSLDVLLTWGTTRITAVKVRHDPRRLGESNYTFRKLVRHALNMMTGFSILPLQIASLLGFAFALFGLLVLVYVVGRFLIQGGSVPGFPFLASIIAIFSGVQLFALGIIGEYLARMHFRLMDQPPYIISDQTSEPISVSES